MEKRLTEDERQFVLDAVSYAAEHESNDDIRFISGRLRVTSERDRKGRFTEYPNVDVTETMRKLRMYGGY